MTARNRIVLCMIVKNEESVIARCLASVKPLVSAWVVVDTGSTDRTREIVRDVMKDLPGELVDRPWKNFGHNRTEALELARAHGDYLLVMDADDTLELAEGFTLPPLVHDSYLLPIRYGTTSYDRAQLLRSDKDWRYEGVIHEYPASDRAKTQGKLRGGIRYVISNDGARAKNPDRFRQDAELIESALRAEPENRRYAFYLGQSYRDAQMLPEALAAYERRAAMGGWGEEVFVARLEAARLRERLGQSFDDVHRAYLAAHEARPTRAEALCELARYCRLRDRFALGAAYASAAAQIRRPDDSLFVLDPVYAWRAKDELAVSAYHCGDHDLARRLNEELLASATLPLSEQRRIRDNLQWSRRALERRAA
jgi:glycosyltransferase involved in cell wall biosynthesis